MNSSILLSAQERKALLDLYRRGPDLAVAHRAHIVLLLAEGYSWPAVAAALFTSISTIARWQRRFRQGGVAALAGRPLGRRPWLSRHWAGVVVRWVTRRSPRDFG